MLELDAVAWVLLAVAALIIGLSKAALPGAATISVAIFAGVLPARSSTAVFLVLAIVGDAFALWAYRQHANWAVLLRLIPAVVGGMILGAVFLAFADDGSVRRVIGVILLALVAFSLWLMRQRAVAAQTARGTLAMRLGYGSLGGFTTMVANAGGPAMSMYFLASRLDVKTFLGTTAWFFAIVNVAKLPFAVGIGLLGPQQLLVDAVLAPAVIVGGFVGRAIVHRISQRVFDGAVIVLTVIGALYLILAP